MPNAVCSEEEFIDLIESGGPEHAARVLGVAVRNIFGRRKRLEKKLGRKIIAPDVTRRNARIDIPAYPERIDAKVHNGIVIIASDMHYWPGEKTTAHRALIKFCRDLKPAIVILNGDVLDGATVSRHPAMNWEKRPSLAQELETVRERLDEITLAAPKARRIWTLGNHDRRLEARLAQVAPEYAKVRGVHLHDHFPDFEPCWEVYINDAVVVRHRLKGGIHATHNNTLHAGKTVITGHLHSQKVTAWSDYNGVRWGFDTGCVAEAYGPQFSYMEAATRNWRSGFGVIKFIDGELLEPKTVRVMREGVVEYCHEVFHV